MTDGLSALLLLADGRFPAGGHAHSGGLEPVIAARRVLDVRSLESFLRGRAATAGLVGASFAVVASDAIARADRPRLTELDAELDARLPSPAIRRASRKLGRQMVRAIRAIRPDRGLDLLPASPHQPMAFGAAAASFGLGAREASLAVLHDAVTGPAAAAVRLLGLDPFAVHAALARIGPQLDELSVQAARHVATEPDDLPALSAPLLDVSTEQHATWEVRLFAS